MDPFAEIRPYNDSEVAAVLERLLADPEFLGALTRFRFKRLSGVLPGLLRRLVGWQLRRQLKGVASVTAMQAVIEGYMDRMISDTTAGFSVSGLDQLDPGQPFLFMSNHRDIAMDPAFTNYALWSSGHNTVRIAIGDNLLTKPYVSDLMRLNKSFIVRRSVRGPRQILKAYRDLSAYIRHSLLEEQAPIWIAQREGRAKDGVDRTEPAIIKMLAMSQDKANESFSEYIGGLNIVPVTISYELDPCDEAKARELAAVASSGSYEKAEHEDVESIAKGIAGNKGQVHVAFGTPLKGDYDNADAVAAEIDRQICANYVLHGTNIYAYRALHGDDAALPQGAAAAGSCDEAEFNRRMQAIPEDQRPYALAIYANAVVSQLAAEA
ncbi:glycerol acyltransferase [Halieaceae bacterium IMCC14734]|uniref:Glycerol acyltransferase n=1 Tax=Candidatus Litorirhabdus singularis TaxID=2518993 RepID=A0ABT3TAS5_9GAMM|nr:1-acyl-sn-glycerol-3-phosphate acyltransferase [Candidatus Litorirhabdus singularis]MCX2979377.1 glycerol acyltransferase [Candidatus Litorirhabdus singularis]